MLFKAFPYPVGLYVLLVCTLIYFSNASYIANYQRRPNCGLDQFRCQSGECIDESEVCDGNPQCFDNSDETENICSQIHCPRQTLRCSYGACVSKRARCDGVRNCFDGSDEQGCPADTNIDYEIPKLSQMYSTSRPQLPVNCHIPNHPENGQYTIGGQNADSYGTGDVVAPFSVLVTNCDYGYQTSPPNTEHSVCANGIWTPIPSKCSRHPQATRSETSGECSCHCPLVLIK